MLSPQLAHVQVCRVSMEEDVETSVMISNAHVPHDLWAIDVKLKVTDNKKCKEKRNKD